MLLSPTFHMLKISPSRSINKFVMQTAPSTPRSLICLHSSIRKAHYSQGSLPPTPWVRICTALFHSRCFASSNLWRLWRRAPARQWISNFWPPLEHSESFAVKTGSRKQAGSHWRGWTSQVIYFNSGFLFITSAIFLRSSRLCLSQTWKARSSHSSSIHTFFFGHPFPSFFSWPTNTEWTLKSAFANNIRLVFISRHGQRFSCSRNTLLVQLHFAPTLKCFSTLHDWKEIKSTPKFDTIAAVKQSIAHLSTMTQLIIQYTYVDHFYGEMTQSCTKYHHVFVTAEICLSKE